MNAWARAAVQGAACGLMVGLVLLIGGRLWQPVVAAAQVKQPAVADVVKARGFEVVDAAGKVRAGMGVLPLGEVALALEDPAGKTRANLHLVPDGSPFLRLLDAAGKAGLTLGVRLDGRSDLVLWDPAGNQRATLSVTRRGPSLILWDAAAQEPVWQAP